MLKLGNAIRSLLMVVAFGVAALAGACSDQSAPGQQPQAPGQYDGGATQ
jgi:hypothetical protein